MRSDKPTTHYPKEFRLRSQDSAIGPEGTFALLVNRREALAVKAVRRFVRPHQRRSVVRNSRDHLGIRLGGHVKGVAPFAS